MTDSVFKIYCSTWKMKHRTWAMTKIICIKMLIKFWIVGTDNKSYFISPNQPILITQTHFFNGNFTRIVWFGLRKKLFDQAFSPVYRGFFRSLSVTSKEHWVPKILFVILINSTRFFSQQLLLTAFNMC